MTDINHAAYVPLFNFWCELNALDLAPGMRLRRLDTLPPINFSALSDYERRELEEPGYWLVFDPHVISDHSVSARMNQWALALWLVRPTKLSLRFRFEETIDGCSRNFVRVSSAPCWNSEDVDPGPFSSDELSKALVAFSVFDSIPSASRLGVSLSLTAEGYWQSRWHAGIALYSAAVETLLTCDRGPGLTTRLAQAYAALVAPGQGQITRFSTIAAFRAAYDARSGVMHGRSNLCDAGVRLRALALWAEITRDVWRVVVEEPLVLSALQDTDATRKSFLASR